MSSRDGAKDPAGLPVRVPEAVVPFLPSAGTHQRVVRHVP